MSILVIGEALVDVVDDGAGNLTEMPGGSPANVAITLARLGHAPELITCLADDPRGAVVRAWLQESGVQVRAFPPPSGRTSTAVATLASDGSASYRFDISWDLPEVTPACSVLHAGSIATALSPGAKVVENVMRAARGRALVSFDPNARPQITPDADATRAQVERLVALADVVKVSDEDLAWYYPGLSPSQVALAWAASGPALVVVTLGADGALVVRGSDTFTVPGVKVQVADTIGAGDTFMGALLDALIGFGATGPGARGRIEELTVADLRAAASWAARAAAITVSRLGANPPTRAELDRDSQRCV